MKLPWYYWQPWVYLHHPHSLVHSDWTVVVPAIFINFPFSRMKIRLMRSQFSLWKFETSDFYEIWYEHHDIWGHLVLVYFYFLLSVTTTWESNEFVRWERHSEYKTTWRLREFYQSFQSNFGIVRGCIQKFPDWPPGARTANDTVSATRCSCIAILWLSLVSFAAITLCVGSQRVFISLSTRSGNIWIHPRIRRFQFHIDN
jgi:hypothetical protein